jgi:hypothetical protein
MQTGRAHKKRESLSYALFLSFISTGVVFRVHMRPEPPLLIDGKLIKLANSIKVPEL